MQRPKNKNPQISVDLITESTTFVNEEFSKGDLQNRNDLQFDELIKNIRFVYYWLPVSNILTKANLLKSNVEPGKYLLDNNFAQLVGMPIPLKDGSEIYHPFYISTTKGVAFLNYLLCEFIQVNMMYAPNRTAVGN